MSKIPPFVSHVLVAGIFLGLAIGCHQSATTDGTHASHQHNQNHQHPDNYSDLVHEIEHVAEDVLAAFAEGNGESVHGQLHEVGHLLDNVAPLAKKAGFQGEELAEITAAAEKAFKAFSSLDTFHGNTSDKEVDLTQVSDDANSGIAVLVAHQPEGEDHHDHDGDIHDEHEHSDHANHDDDEHGDE